MPHLALPQTQQPAIRRPAPLARMLQLIAALALLVLPATSEALAASPAAALHEPASGSGERREILDAVRPLLEVRVDPPVEFVVDWIRVAGPWAFVIVNPQRPGGTPIDLSRTTFAENAEYMDGLRTYVLLAYAYGRWNVVDQAIGPTDVFWDGDPLYDRVPKGLIPH